LYLLLLRMGRRLLNDPLLMHHLNLSTILYHLHVSMLLNHLHGSLMLQHSTLPCTKQKELALPLN
jgi:hypothetical protein